MRIWPWAYYFMSFLFLFGDSSWILAQEPNLGIPPMRHFSRKMYQAGTQNWDAGQDSRGVMYWANNDGLLRYDGTYWSLLPVSNHTIVRSLAIDPTDRIYIGAQGEIGYFSTSVNGALVYTSLVGLLPQGQRGFEDVWDIVFHDGAVFFRTNHLIFKYLDGRMEALPQDGELLCMFSTPSGLILQKAETGLWVFREGNFKPYSQPAVLRSAITGVMSWEQDTLILSTLKNGLFYLKDNKIGRWTTSYDPLLISKRIYSATSLPGGHLALGTSLDGLVVLDQHRRVVRHLSKKSGLQNNNILNTYADRQGNVWLGLDNGIDVVLLNSPFNYIFPDDDLQGTGYAASLHDGQLYFGVSNGAYTAPWQSYYDPEGGPLFKKVNGSDGQVWGFSIAADQLLMGHHEGAFHISGYGAHPIDHEQGTWTFVPMSDVDLLAGTYTGLVHYRKTDGVWAMDQKVKGLNESCRILVRDADGSVWVSHPYRGLYHVAWSPLHPGEADVRFYNTNCGLPSALNNYVFSIAGKAFFATQQGVYVYDKTQDRFIEDEDFKRLLGPGQWVKYLKEDLEGNVWYVTDREVGMLVVDDFGLKKEVAKRTFPELHGKLVGGFESIYPVDASNLIIGTEQGFLHYHISHEKSTDTLLQIVFGAVLAQGTSDTLLFGGFGSLSPDGIPSLTAGLNNFSFTFSATEYHHPELVEYQVMLDGLEKNWSAWSVETRRNYTALPPGEYTFKVRARIKDSKESNLIQYSFVIRPPWYKSKIAFGLYGLCAIGLFAGFTRRQRHRFESEKAQMTETHQQKEAEHIREVEQSKAALTEIQHEKLEVEIKFKNQELALTTMHLVQKAEILLTVQEALNQILEKSKTPEVKKEIQTLLNLLNFDVKLDEDWEHFAYHFDQVHVDFLKHLREQFPQLSNNDYKLCAYLRMNLTTKEIAPLMNISVRGVEGSRYRLRKKLNLPNDANLTEFILNLGQGIKV